VLFERYPGVRRLPGRLRRPQDDVVFFDSWGGKFSDSPRVISERLHEREPRYRHIWVADEATERTTLPGWATPVRRGSRGYMWGLNAARHIVVNTHLPSYFHKRRGSVYVQTWHGTPLKRIGLDVPGPQFVKGGTYFERLRKDVAQWDYLISPSPFCTEVFRAAFDFGGEILESGYPRNDPLAADGAAAAGRAVRAELGIGERTTAVLYAPTWRDGMDFELRLDLALMRRRLGDDHVVLLRLHPSQAAHAPGGGDGVIDVSGRGDIADLYLAADVLVTDYSSTMFDFAVTGKPMVFFTYDLADYRDVTRGFYLDFERDAPGPLLATTEEVCAALRDLDHVVASYADAYARFAERFCSLEDGRAADRVIDAVFAS
jgi:CDP-glycerol glycerophosphotransferase